MAEFQVLDINKQSIGKIEVSDAIFGVKVKEHIVQQYVKLQLASRRSGSAATKQNKGELRGSGKKPWRQKGTGRARSGTTRSPLWRGGLTVFGPSPRDYSFKISKKAKKLALKSVLTQRAQIGGIAVMEKIVLGTHKTKEAAIFIKTMGFPEKTLFVISDRQENLERAVKNLPLADVLHVEGLNVFDLLMHEKIVCTPETIKKIEKRLD